MSCRECVQCHVGSVYNIYHSPNWSTVVSDSLSSWSSVSPVAKSGQPPNMVASVSPGPRLKAVMVW